MRRSPLRPQSKRRRKRDAAYPAARQAVYVRAEGMCEAQATWRCEREAQQVHHIAGRVGPDPHRLANLLAVCRICHDVIHAMPERSYANGWMVSRHANLQNR